MKHRPLNRRDFFHRMAEGFATISALQLLQMEKLFAAPAEYQYFIAIMPHSLALLKAANDVSLHGDVFQGYGNWRFAGAGTLSGLDSIRNNVFIPRGLTYGMQPGTEGVGHFQAQGGFLTGYPTRGASTYDSLVGANNTTPPAASVQSIDWMIAKKSGFEPIALGYRNRPAFNGAEAPHFFKAISWRDPSNAYYPVFDSAALLAQLKARANCSAFTTDPNQIQSQIAKESEKQTLIRRVQKQYAVHYRNHRSHADAYERYLDDFSNHLISLQKNIDSLEVQKRQSLMKPLICDSPVPTFKESIPSESDNGYYEGKVRELNSLIVSSFKAGITNSATLSLCLEKCHSFQHYISRSDIGRDGVTEAQIMSNGQGLQEYMDSVTKGLVHLVQQLKSQGIFDKTLILFGGEQNDGNTHMAKEAPVLVIDGKNPGWNGKDLGTLAGGQATPESRPYADLLVDIAKKFGLEVSELGSSLNVKGVGRGGIF